MGILATCVNDIDPLRKVSLNLGAWQKLHRHSIEITPKKQKLVDFNPLGYPPFPNKPRIFSNIIISDFRVFWITSNDSYLILLILALLIFLTDPYRFLPRLLCILSVLVYIRIWNVIPIKVSQYILFYLGYIILGE